MTEFEFYSIASSIVLALALGKLISSIPSVFSRSRFDWVFSLFFLTTALWALFQWNQIWALHTHDSWSMRDFVLLMAPSIALYLAVHVLVSDTPLEIEKWRDHFPRIRRWYFVALLVMALLSQVRDYFIVDDPFELLLLSPILVVLGLGAVLDHRLAHAVIAVVMACGLSAAVFLLDVWAA